MHDHCQNPFEYLTPPLPSLWQWKDDGQVISWQEAGTIVFRRELELILRSSQLEHLPALSDIVLVLVACRDSWQQVSQIVAEDVESTEVNHLLDALSRISRLPSSLRNPIEAKAGLIDFVFEQYPATMLTPQTDSICAALEHVQPIFRDGLQSVSPGYHGPGPNTQRLIKALERLDTETLQLRQATGLDHLVWPAAIEFKTAEESRALVSKLYDEDVEFRGLARLARALMAVVHLPRAIADPEDLPMGGFSDITNRGSVDRLLVSELAHDDLTLSIRLALNEALYLRRESPPKTPSQSRSLLIDAGIRMWGVPRVFAASVALALAATADEHAAVSAFHATSHRLARVDLTTREGLVDLLAAQEVDAHPGKSLAEFFTESCKNDSHTDHVIVTCAETANDREFCQLLRRYEVPSLYLATVNRNGEFQLIHQAVHGRKVVCEAKLSLDEVIAPSASPPLPLLQVSKDLPAIFRLNDFPFRIPNHHRGQYWFVRDVGVFQISRNRRLLLWDNPNLGPRQIDEFVPWTANVVWNDSNCRDGHACAVLANPYSGDSKTLLSFDTATNSLRLLPLHEHIRNKITGYNGVVYSICGDTEVRFLSQFDGRLLGSFNVPQDGPLVLPQYQHIAGRFFREKGSGAWFTLTFDGDTGRLERTVDRATQAHFHLIGMYDWLLHEGPVGVTKDGKLFLPEQKECSDVIENEWGKLQVVRFDPAGERLHVIAFPKDAPKTYGRINLSSGQLESHSSIDIGVLFAQQYVSPDLKVRHKFTGIVANERLGIALVSRKGWCWWIHLVDHKIQLSHSGTSSTEFASQVRYFYRQDLVAKRGFWLKSAQWQDGSRAWLDSRGLLHLRSANRRIPECSIVLSEGPMAGWCSDGRVWGDPFFTGDQDNVNDVEVFQEIIQPFFDQLL